MLEQRIQQQFFDIADLQYQSAQALSRPIADAAQALIGCITAGGKLLVGGSGGGAALAQYFCATLIHRFERDRPGLAALALAADGVVVSAQVPDSSLAAVFARQVLALGQPGDVLLLLDATGESQALAAIDAAHTRDMSVVLLCGTATALRQEQSKETDVLVRVPHERAARVLELQLLVLHCLCDAVDLQLMGEQESQ
ncbi:MAG: SIS domain-containing protein [Rubrivivax sp.]